MKDAFARLDKETQNWVKKIAAKNNVTPEDVLAYLDSLSSGKMVIHHLSLV